MPISIDPNNVNVLLVSDNPFVTDFLKVLVKTHGYEMEAVTDLHQALTRVRHNLVRMIFIDDACLRMDNLENLQLQLQGLSHEGRPVILLTNEQIEHHFAQQPPISLFRIMRKPVGYLQIVTVLADFLPPGNGTPGKLPLQTP